MAFFTEKSNATELLPRVLSDASHAVGYTSITEEDLQQLSNTQSPNKKAYSKMLEAVRVALTNNEQTSDQDIDPYPVTAEATQEMDQLLDEAEKEVKDPEEAFYQKILKELRGIVGWSAHKHFHFSWPVIVGALITIVGAVWFYYHNSNSYLSARGEYNCVKAWSTDPDAPGIDVDKVSDGRITPSWGGYSSPADYKDFWLSIYRDKYDKAKETYEKYTAKLEKATKRKEKEDAKYWINSAEEKMDKYGPLVSELSSADTKGVKKFALKQTKANMRKERPMYAFAVFLLLYSILIFPLYIISSYGYGYTISRFRWQDKLLNDIRSMVSEFAADLTGEANAIKYFPDKKVIYHYSDGSTKVKREADERNTGRRMGAAIIYIIAILAVTLTSMFIMAYSTFVGFKRNYTVR